MKPYMINENDLFEEAQNFVKRVEMKTSDEMREINLNLAFDITFAITKAMFPCEMEDGGSKKEQFVFNDKYDIKAIVLWNSTEKRGYSIKS